MVKASLPSKNISCYDFQKDIQCIVMELNVANKKYVIFSIYRPPKQHINYFLNSLSDELDLYLKHFENICILGNFNPTPSKPHLIKNPTCFKSSNGSAIDLIVTKI